MPTPCCRGLCVTGRNSSASGKKEPTALSGLNLGVAEVVRLQKTQNSYEFGYSQIET